jgi:hypothetical protein
MKRNFQLSDILLVIIPIAMLIIAMAIDYLEPILSKYYSRTFKIDLLVWLWSLGRVVFVLVIFTGVLYFINNKHRSKLHCFVWLGLGFMATFASTPWGHQINLLNIHTRFLIFFPRYLSFLAGAFLLATGIYGLIRPVENRQD